MSRSNRLLAQFCCFASAVVSFGAVSAAGQFLVIDGDSVSYEEFEQFAYSEARQTYYHGKPPEGPAMLEFRQQAAQKFIDQKLKVREALRIGLEADQAQVEANLARYEQQYGGTPRSQAQGPEMTARLRKHFEEESLLEQIDLRLRAAPDPSDGDVEAYYRANIDKFTEPEQVRVSVILLAVPPWADEEAWTTAREEAAELARRIRDGTPFAEVARAHSADPTAANGGDMGYLHVGALNQAVQVAVSELREGEMSPDPVTVLEGVVLVRLEDRKGEQVHEFDDVRERAAGLWRREAAEQAYAVTMERLRNSAQIQVDDEYLMKLP